MMLVFSVRRRKRGDKWKRKQDSGGKRVAAFARMHMHHLTNSWGRKKKRERVARNNTDTFLFIAAWNTYGVYGSRRPSDVNRKNKSRRTRRPPDNAAVYKSFMTVINGRINLPTPSGEN